MSLASPISVSWPPVGSGYLYNQSETGSFLPFLKNLISLSEEILLCSGWIRLAALRDLEAELGQAVIRGAKVTLISNSAHTKKDSTALLKKLGVVHIIVDQRLQRYFHTKLYYFRSQTQYCAIVGSANLTGGAIKHNEELSRYVSGTIEDDEYRKLSPYLQRMEVEYGTGAYIAESPTNDSAVRT